MIAPRRDDVRVVSPTASAPGPLLRARSSRKAIAHWRELHTDDGAGFDSETIVDASRISPQGHLGDEPRKWCGAVTDQRARARGVRQPRRPRGPPSAALAYMDPPARHAPSSRSRSTACSSARATNSRIGDLRAAAEVVQGPQGRGGASTRWSCPASQQVKKQAEAEGLDEVFRAARLRLACRRLLDVPGHEPRHPGAPASVAPRRQTRNFEGRQGRGGPPRTSSPRRWPQRRRIEGHFVDIRSWS